MSDRAYTEDIEQGQKGEDDGLIQYHQSLAEQGNVDSMMQLSDLYYNGQRGTLETRTLTTPYPDFNGRSTSGSG